MNLIDTHTHLYAEEFKQDIDAVIARAQAAGVETFYLPGIDSNDIPAMLQLEADYPGVCKPMMGLHPCYVKENWEAELAIIEQWLKQRSFAAVGEIGLDYYWDTQFKTQQQSAFNQQMEWAVQYQLPIVIHTRNAMQDTIEAVKPFAAKGLKGIFHCFGGSIETARQITDMGFLLGIGGVLTYKNAALPAVLKEIELRHLVLETDAPYLSPVPYRGKRNESSYLSYILERLAAVKNQTIEEVAAITTENARSLFKY
ncbi:MAG: TatD family deoxyribonuclease [Sphingobacteriia bacterium]|nr:MAG: TatD family deoxyribonuclease [Sphingobacteriia bacterium]